MPPPPPPYTIKEYFTHIELGLILCLDLWYSNISFVGDFQTFFCTKSYPDLYQAIAELCCIYPTLIDYNLSMVYVLHNFILTSFDSSIQRKNGISNLYKRITRNRLIFVIFRQPFLPCLFIQFSSAVPLLL